MRRFRAFDNLTEGARSHKRIDVPISESTFPTEEDVQRLSFTGVNRDAVK
jgi:hypothetical protein